MSVISRSVAEPTSPVALLQPIAKRFPPVLIRRLWGQRNLPLLKNSLRRSCHSSSRRSRSAFAGGAISVAATRRSGAHSRGWAAAKASRVRHCRPRCLLVPWNPFWSSHRYRPTAARSRCSRARASWCAHLAAVTVPRRARCRWPTVSGSRRRCPGQCGACPTRSGSRSPRVLQQRHVQ